jgi:antitoxin MazE
MQTTVSKWGNSLALRLPRHIAEGVKLTEGQTVEFEISDESLIIRPTRKRFKLTDLLAGYEKSQKGEIDGGKPEGDEAW